MNKFSPWALLTFIYINVLFLLISCKSIEKSESDTKFEIPIPFSQGSRIVFGGSLEPLIGTWRSIEPIEGMYSYATVDKEGYIAIAIGGKQGIYIGDESIKCSEAMISRSHEGFLGKGFDGSLNCHRMIVKGSTPHLHPQKIVYLYKLIESDRGIKLKLVSRFDEMQVFAGIKINDANPIRSSRCKKRQEDESSDYDKSCFILQFDEKPVFMDPNRDDLIE